MKTPKLKHRIRNSGLPWPLLTGFGLMMVIMIFFWYGNLHHMDSLYRTTESSRTASEKMEVIATLIEIARTRTRLTNKMLHTPDPFLKDEIGLELDTQATRFAVTRQKLFGLGLSPREKSILERQAEIIQPILAQQRLAAEMAMSDDPEVVNRARDLLIDKVYTGQGQIIDFFMQLLKLQKETINHAGNEAARRYDMAVRLETWLLFVLLASAGGIAVIVILRTIRTEKALFLEKERAQITLKSIGDAVITTDQEGKVDYLNPVAEKITGHLTADVRGQPITQVFRAYDEKNERWLADCVLRFLQTGSYSLPSSDLVLFTLNDQKIDIALTIAPIQGRSDEVLGTITTFQDITRTKTMARRIAHQAQHDPLTGLLNRREFETKVSQALELYSEDTLHALCVLDLDRFKIVNDTAGHTAGDELLRQISQRVRKCLRKGDLLARIGGDEFAIFLSNAGQRDAVVIAEKILARIREFQFLWNRKTYRVQASIGLVDAAPQSADYEYLYHAADTACYIAKHEGRDRVSVVSLDDQWLSAKRAETQWANHISEALQEDRFVLYAQDICYLGSEESRPKHREILIRLKGEDGEIIPPMAFLPAAERYSLMPRIDEWVLRKVIAWIRDTGSRTVYAVNMSGQSMGDPKFAERILEILEAAPIDTSQLCFEVTETAAIANLENAQMFLNKLQTCGCQTALDDFGSGLSSFAYLRNLPIDYLKIDGMFIKEIVEDETSRVMVEAIQKIGKTMNLKTIAEFVENEAIKEIIEDLGVDYGQGYYFEKPEPLTNECDLCLESSDSGFSERE